jgi:hypothetical protein
LRSIDAREMARVVGLIFGLPDAADETTISRIKHLQTLHFPENRKVGTGHRRSYGFTEALKVCAAFQLADGGMSSALAVRLLAAEWSRIVPAMVVAAAGDRAGPLIGIVPFALSQDTKRVLNVKPASVTIARGKAVPSKWADPHRPRVLLDPYALVDELKRALRRMPGIAADEVESAAQTFATSADVG